MSNRAILIVGAVVAAAAAVAVYFGAKRTKGEGGLPAAFTQGLRGSAALTPREIREVVEAPTARSGRGHW